jgi:Rad3-related DNA helicase
MEWDWQNRRLKMSVGELAGFSLHTPSEPRSGRWRMELGSHWHQVLRDRIDQAEEGWTFEESVRGRLTQSGWDFDLRGRVDQLNPARERPALREIKTVSKELPADEDTLRAAYPAYFHQALLYAFLLGKKGTFPETELVFLEIQTGITQSVTLDDRDMEALHAHLTAVVGELEERRGHFSLLRNFIVPQPFPEWRPGQREVRESLDAALDDTGISLLEAPTGFGKTGLALEQGLLRLAAGEVERIILLSGKNTGHTPLLKQLEAFRSSGKGLTVHALRSRKDHALEEDGQDYLPPGEISDRWIKSGLSAPALLANGILSLEDVRGLGRQHGIPPWAISRMLLPYADIWIADFNYLFDPAVCQVLHSIPTFDPARTLLIVDEAHNLPERAAASRSHRLETGEIEALLAEVQFARFPGTLARLLDQLLSMVKRQPSCDQLEPPDESDLIGLLREIRESLDVSSFGDDELSPDSLEWLWNLSYILGDWDHPHISMVAHAPKKGCIRLSCINAAAVIGPTLAQFHRSILMSATLKPWPDFRQAAGIEETLPTAGAKTSCEIEGIAPWLEGCFEVIVDARVDTRYRQRESCLDITAGAIGDTASGSRGCVAVFFPSYKYAEMAMERVQFRFPLLRCELQPRDLALEEQNTFLENALRHADVLFLVLGSRFSEGIDTLGGQVEQAIVVSPALPEVNSLQRLREAAFPGPAPAAFRSLYLIPGLRKISQALGRLVRTPEQRARVLLHGKRFMEPSYQDLMPIYLSPVDHIVTDEDFARKWLKSV